MRKVITLSLILLSGSALFAQSLRITGAAPKTLTSPAGNASKVTVVDTLTDYLDRATAYYILTAGSNGYVLGTATGITETAVHYDGLGATTVTEVIAYFAAKEIMGNADSMVAAVYSADLDSMPLLPLGTGKFSVNDVDTSGFPTFIPVSATATTGGFLVSIMYGGGGLDDSVAVLSTNPLAQGGGPDGNGEKRCRQNTVGGWMRAADIWTISGNAYDADALIIPIVDFTAVSVDGHVGRAGLNLYPSYPNPAGNHHHIVWSHDATEDVGLVVYDVHGRRVFAHRYSQMNAGQHSVALATESWATGSYYYVVSTGKASIGSKFMVQH